MRWLFVAALFCLVLTVAPLLFDFAGTNFFGLLFAFAVFFLEVLPFTDLVVDLVLATAAFLALVLLGGPDKYSGQLVT